MVVKKHRPKELLFSALWGNPAVRTDEADMQRRAKPTVKRNSEGSGVPAVVPEANCSPAHHLGWFYNAFFAPIS